MLSQHKLLALKRFGKFEITFIGEAGIYLRRLNVPAALRWFTNKGLRTNAQFINLFYAASAQLDKTHFTCKNKNPLNKLLTNMTNPFMPMFFLWTREKPSVLNWVLSWVV
jgi:hypothetical protein